jgi:dTDP-4-dehydrorhamnose reductase
MRILLFGKYGQLGWELQRTLACLGQVSAFDYPEVDFTRPEMLCGVIESVQPDLLINAIAYTDVDKAEGEPEKARLVNAVSVGTLAETATRLNIPFIHYSTDYVFNGKKKVPYSEEDAPDPISAYGQTKLEGEQAITQVGGAYLIFRTSWVYSMRKGGFVNKVLDWSREQAVVRIVDDQIGNPTWARMLAEITGLLLSHIQNDPLESIKKLAGTYHLAGDGFISRYDWAKAILEINPETRDLLVKKLKPAKSSDYPTPAQRPSFSALNCELFKHTFGLSLPPWKLALAQCME